MFSPSSAYICSRLEPHFSRPEAAALSRAVCVEILGWRPVDYYADKDRLFTPKEAQTVDTIIDRLCRHEPLQYIMGYTTFLGHRIGVSPAVLIPRPETEELVEHVLSMLPDSPRIADLCTGSGCIAIALKLARRDAVVTALELSPQAIAVAQQNAEALGADIRLVCADVLTYEPTAERSTYDCVVSNPPYVCHGEREAMQPEVADHEPAMALFVPDDDPLRFYRAIGSRWLTALRPGGRLCLEVNRRYAHHVAELLQNQGYHKPTVYTDLSGNERFVFATRKYD